MWDLELVADIISIFSFPKTMDKRNLCVLTWKVLKFQNKDNKYNAARQYNAIQ